MKQSTWNDFLWSLPQPLISFGCAWLTATACVYKWVDPWLLVNVFFWSSFPIFILLEKIYPKRKDWLVNWKDMGVDTFWVVGTMLVWIPLFVKYYDPHISVVFHSLREAVGFTWSFQAETIWGLLFMAFLATLAMEFIGYWSHRLQHRFLFLWRIHATHHHITKMSVARTDRTHPLEFLGLNLGGAIALAFFGASGDVIAVTIGFKVAAVHLNHCNLPFKSGVYGWLFTTAELHQVHHSLNFDDSNKNYGCVMIVWDRIFGTYSAGNAVAAVGSGSGQSLSLWRQICIPFMTNRGLREL